MMRRRRIEMNPYPTTWPQFLTLRAAREQHWIKLPREDYDAHPSRKQRKIYFDPDARVYYLITMIQCAATDDRDRFLAEHTERAKQELLCYQHAALFGFHVPEIYSQIIHIDNDAAGNTLYQSVLATSEITGTQISTLLKQAPPPHAVLQEALYQAITLSILFADRDRGNSANIIAGASNQLYHIDFEEAGKSGPDRLFKQLEANEYDLKCVDWDEVLLRLEKIKRKLLSIDRLTVQQRELYNARIEIGSNYIKRI